MKYENNAAMFFRDRSPKSREPNFKKLMRDFISVMVDQERSDNPNAPTKSLRGSSYRHTATGYRHDMQKLFRSRWEANFARVLGVYNIPFEFEPKIFSYPIKKGTISYVPDFYLPNTDEWVEMKGYLDDKSKTKIKRFKKFYPQEFSKYILIISKYSKDGKAFAESIGINTVLYYEDISSEYSSKIPFWEGGHKK